MSLPLLLRPFLPTQLHIDSPPPLPSFYYYYYFRLLNSAWQILTFNKHSLSLSNSILQRLSAASLYRLVNGLLKLGPTE